MKYICITIIFIVFGVSNLFCQDGDISASGIYVDGKWKYEFKMELSSSNGKVEGQFTWKYKSGKYASYKRGKKAIEYVRGSCNQYGNITLRGYKKKDPNNIIALDGYTLKCSKNKFTGSTSRGVKLSGKTKSYNISYNPKQSNEIVRKELPTSTFQPSSNKEYEIMIRDGLVGKSYFYIDKENVLRIVYFYKKDKAHFVTSPSSGEFKWLDAIATIATLEKKGNIMFYPHLDIQFNNGLGELYSRGRRASDISFNSEKNIISIGGGVLREYKPGIVYDECLEGDCENGIGLIAYNRFSKPPLNQTIAYYGKFSNGLPQGKGSAYLIKYKKPVNNGPFKLGHYWPDTTFVDITPTVAKVVAGVVFIAGGAKVLSDLNTSRSRSNSSNYYQPVSRSSDEACLVIGDWGSPKVSELLYDRVLTAKTKCYDKFRILEKYSDPSPYTVKHGLGVVKRFKTLHNSINYISRVVSEEKMCNCN